MKTGPILLIDDDADDCELVTEALAHAGVKNEVICFSDGAAAFAYLKTTATQPFLIISDINMPGQNGLQLRRQINGDQQVKDKAIPFIFLTTSASIEAIRQAYEMSVQGFFEKGHTLQEISTLLREVCHYWQRCRHPRN